MTHIFDILLTLSPATNHIVVMTCTKQKSRELINELRTAKPFTGEGRVFFVKGCKNDTRISIVSSEEEYEGAENFSLFHWGWYNQPNETDMKKVQQWEAKATEILTK